MATHALLKPILDAGDAQKLQVHFDPFGGLEEELLPLFQGDFGLCVDGRPLVVLLDRDVLRRDASSIARLTFDGEGG